MLGIIFVAVNILLITAGLLWVASFIAGFYRMWTDTHNPPLLRLQRFWESKMEIQPVSLPVLKEQVDLDEEWGKQIISMKRNEPFPIVNRLLSERGVSGWLNNEFQKAHVRWQPASFAAVILLVTALAFLAAITVTPVLFSQQISSVMRLMSGFLFAGLIPILAFLWLRYLQKKFLLWVELVLPDTLALIANALRSGIGLQQAMELVAQQGLSPLREEFAIVNQEIALGFDLDGAFDNLLKRVPSPELLLVINAVLVQREVGGSLAQIFDSAAETVRMRLHLRREMRALTAQARASAFFLAFFIPLFLIFAVNAVTFLLSRKMWSAPMIEDLLGRVAIVAAVVLEIFGWAYIRRIIHVEY